MKQIPILIRAFAPSRLRAFALACALPLASWAQQVVSGTVSDENGLPLPGATVVVQNTNRGTTTDFDGNYQIQANQGETLVFSYVGYASQNIIVGATDTIDVQMQVSGLLEEVVVTGQNIEREVRSLGYAVTSLGSDAVQSKTEGDIGRILSGQVAGLNVIATNGISGSGTNIIIRGYSTITGSNQPLFVVDGIPYNSSTNEQTNFLDNSTESSRFFDIDPNLIENISILKGLSATVLYGEEGRNGVILITTKNATRGEKAKGFEVSLDQSVFFSEAILPKYQNNYGGGFHQGYGFFFSNWGPRFDRTDGDLISLAGQFIGTDTDGSALLLHPFNFLSDQSLIVGYEDLLTQPYRYQP